MGIVSSLAADRKTSLAWVDISKGITIILMVLGHTSLPNDLSRWIWSFHMPFFFFISGLLTSFDKPLWKFVRHKAKQLLVPFLWYSVIVWILYAVGSKEDIISLGINILFDGWGGIALWFVPVLFVSLLVVKIVNQRWLPVLIIVAIYVGSILDKYKILAPWTMSSVPFATAIMATSRFFRAYFLKLFEKCQRFKIALIFIFAGFMISVIVSHFWRLDMACNRINPVILIFIGAIAGIIFISVLSVILAKYSVKICNGVLIWCGKNTYEIMALSQVVIINMNTYLSSNPIVKYGVMAASIYIAVNIRDIISRKSLANEQSNTTSKKQNTLLN